LNSNKNDERTSGNLGSAENTLTIEQL